ncbi:hypothetical protein [Streptomyces sp. NPDC051567]|uniref:RapZ C-terminal domain-containing protein n=1 Tax=Streptomyces sp. NPDC051567 TaxID=3365660 RepID=UPI0037884D2A
MPCLVLHYRAGEPLAPDPPDLVRLPAPAHLPTGPDGSPVPPAADRIEDVRARLRDPAAARDILDLDGFHPRVQDVVLNTPGARELLTNLADYADLPAGPRRIAIGCAGGRHRASGLTELLAR